MNDFYIFRKKLRLLLQRANIEKKYTQNTENEKKISKLVNGFWVLSTTNRCMPQHHQ